MEVVDLRVNCLLNGCLAFEYFFVAAPICRWNWVVINAPGAKAKAFDGLVDKINCFCCYL